MTARRILVASNRGPVSYVAGDDGALVPKRGAGGLVTALSGAVQTTGGLWVASAMSAADREMAASTPTGRLDPVVDEAKYALRLIAEDPQTYDRFYNGISNHMLWFLHHALWNLPYAPTLDSGTRDDWEAYRRVNGRFAEALAEEIDRNPADVLVQDYHLSLVPAALRARAAHARIAYFHHIPFAGSVELSLLPGWIRRDLLTGLLGADLVGFQAARWAENFLTACRSLEDAQVDTRRRQVRWEDRIVQVGVYPITVETDSLLETADSPAVAARTTDLERWLGGRRLLLRVDRTEPSKNILRGFQAYEEFLRRYPGWRRKVCFLALLNPSRQSLPEYRRYTDACREAAEAINAAFGEPDWRPVELRINDDFDEVVAAYGLYDVLLVNPVLDGMNLVAKEGPLLNRRDGVLLLSRTAGAFAELGRQALALDPLDVTATADAINAALRMPAGERARRAGGLRRAAGAGSPADWVARQMADLDRAATREE
ncbi:MAG TPA: trehalose-6-phosphate synthase [Actinomycetota bacterium]|nr:trehalose-6-phosphate synthase [Actinomycetota bacterium]